MRFADSNYIWGRSENVDRTNELHLGNQFEPSAHRRVTCCSDDHHMANSCFVEIIKMRQRELVTARPTGKLSGAPASNPKPRGRTRLSD